MASKPPGLSVRLNCPVKGCGSRFELFATQRLETRILKHVRQDHPELTRWKRGRLVYLFPLLDQPSADSP